MFKARLEKQTAAGTEKDLNGASDNLNYGYWLLDLITLLLPCSSCRSMVGCVAVV